MFFVYVFFFKQKTAYEMRISDWSSDVCSSDLPPVLDPCAREQHLGVDEIILIARGHLRIEIPSDPGIGVGGDVGPEIFRLIGVVLTDEIEHVGNIGALPPHILRAEDRKSVVWGMGVAVRVAIGGRGIIKKKQIAAACEAAE